MPEHSIPPRARATLHAVLAIALVSTLAACGYKGDLYPAPPPPPAASLTTPPRASAPSPDAAAPSSGSDTAAPGAAVPDKRLP